MKNSGIIAIVNRGLYKAAVKQVIQEIKIHEPLEFKENLQACLNGVCHPNYLIIDANAIPKPTNYSLEKIKNKNANCIILVLNAELLEKSAEPYVHTLLHSKDSEKTIHSKFESFFASLDNHENTDNNDSAISDREKEVLHLVALGKTNKEISEALFISAHTVITHRKNITSKLGIRTIAGITVYAVLNGIIDTDEMKQ